MWHPLDLYIMFSLTLWGVYYGSTLKLVSTNELLHLLNLILMPRKTQNYTVNVIFSYITFVLTT